MAVLGLEEVVLLARLIDSQITLEDLQSSGPCSL